MRDFTTQKYEQLLQTIKNHNIPVYGVKSWQEQKPVEGILLRHDVDRKPRSSLRAAEIESKYGIRTTYYFRITRSSFDESVIRQIFQMGHEIGYHYEDLSISKGDYAEAFEQFQKHLSSLRRLVPVETIAMHGSVLSPYDNRDLWSRYNYKDLGVSAEAYLDVDYSEMYYLTDTGRTWGQTRANIRDNVGSSLTADVFSTDSLIAFIAENPTSRIALVMHPERWQESCISWFNQLIKDRTVNIAKCIIAKFY